MVAGCERVFLDRGEFSRVRDRPQRVACVDYIRPGATLMVRAQDRRAGSSTMVIETIRRLQEPGVAPLHFCEDGGEFKLTTGQA